jgi:hypothetical protein
MAAATTASSSSREPGQFRPAVLDPNSKISRDLLDSSAQELFRIIEEGSRTHANKEALIALRDVVDCSTYIQRLSNYQDDSIPPQRIDFMILQVYQSTSPKAPLFVEMNNFSLLPQYLFEQMSFENLQPNSQITRTYHVVRHILMRSEGWSIWQRLNLHHLCFVSSSSRELQVPNPIVLKKASGLPFFWFSQKRGEELLEEADLCGLPSKKKEELLKKKILYFSHDGSQVSQIASPWNNLKVFFKINSTITYYESGYQPMVDFSRAYKSYRFKAYEIAKVVFFRSHPYLSTFPPGVLNISLAYLGNPRDEPDSDFSIFFQPTLF